MIRYYIFLILILFTNKVLSQSNNNNDVNKSNSQQRAAMFSVSALLFCVNFFAIIYMLVTTKTTKRSEFFNIPMMAIILKLGAFITYMVSDLYFIGNYLDLCSRALFMSYLLYIAQGAWTSKFSPYNIPLGATIVPFIVGIVLFLYNTTVYLVITLKHYEPFPSTRLATWTGILYLLPVPYHLFLCTLSHDKNFDDKMLQKFYVKIGATFGISWIAFSIITFINSSYTFLYFSCVDFVGLVLYCIFVGYPVYNLPKLSTLPALAPLNTQEQTSTNNNLVDVNVEKETESSRIEKKLSDMITIEIDLNNNATHAQLPIE